MNFFIFRFLPILILLFVLFFFTGTSNASNSDCTLCGSGYQSATGIVPNQIGECVQVAKRRDGNYNCSGLKGTSYKSGAPGCGSTHAADKVMICCIPNDSSVIAQDGCYGAPNGSTCVINASCLSDFCPSTGECTACTSNSQCGSNNCQNGICIGPVSCGGGGEPPCKNGQSCYDPYALDPTQGLCVTETPVPTADSGSGSLPPTAAITLPTIVCSNPGTNGSCNGIQTGVGLISTDAASFINSIFTIILSISGGIALILIIVSGYQLSLSSGNPEKVKEAQGMLTAAIVGLVFIIFSVAILQIIGVDILGGILPTFVGK